MKRVALIIATLAIAATPAHAASQAKLRPVWMTSKKVENYLEHGLKAWGGVNLTRADFKIAICLDGDYSKAETRIGKTYPSRTTSAGESLYASFACSLGVSGRSFNLYVRPQAHARWLIVANR